jgi:hypothetical protein
MKKIWLFFLLSALVSTFVGQIAFGKKVRGPNVSAIYRIETIAQQLPALSGKQKLPTQEPLPDPAQASFRSLFGTNRTLALEVGRLPAFQKEVRQKDVLALARFTEVVKNATLEQQANLDSLLNIGLQESRPFSTPLEAIFWILEEDDYTRNKEIFQLPLEELLDKAWDFSDSAKWEDYEIVTDRLNAPELVTYYQRLRLVYESKMGKRDATTGDARSLFKSKIGNCYDHSKFATYCLEKAGYKSSVVAVHPVKPSLHVVCQYEANGKTYFMDNGRPDKFLRRGIIPKEEYEMYREKENVRKGESTRDPVYLVQDNE